MSFKPVRSVSLKKNKASEFIDLERTLIDNQRYKLAVAAKSAKWGYKNLAVFCSMKNLAVLAD